jgi:pyoverdine/dityrosine biosynthesis protein Dit1
MRYIVPNVSANHSITYVSEYEGTDVAVGFMNLGQIAQYLGTNQLNYDFIIIDSDNIQTMYSFMIPGMKKIFYVTSYDKFEVEKSKELFENFNRPLQLTKVIISSNLNANEDKYLVHTLENNLIKFDRKVEVLFEDTDRNRAATLQSQLVQNISFKNYTSTYKDSLEYLAALIAEGMVSQSEIKSVIKKY